MPGKDFSLSVLESMVDISKLCSIKFRNIRDRGILRIELICRERSLSRQNVLRHIKANQHIKANWHIKVNRHIQANRYIEGLEIP